MRGTRRRKHVAGVLVGEPAPRVVSAVDAAGAGARDRRRAAGAHGAAASHAERIDLERRVHDLARRHGLPPPRSVVWAENQAERWGSCTPDARSIRVSSRLAAFPVWVLDYVIVHELAHLVEPNHGPAFHDLVARYPLAERARGFLIAKDLDPGREG